MRPHCAKNLLGLRERFKPLDLDQAGSPVRANYPAMWTWAYRASIIWALILLGVLIFVVFAN